jgi:hypothetical protein
MGSGLCWHNIHESGDGHALMTEPVDARTKELRKPATATRPGSFTTGLWLLLSPRPCLISCDKHGCAGAGFYTARVKATSILAEVLWDSMLARMTQKQLEGS